MALIPAGMMVEDEVASDIRSPRNLPAFSTGEVLALPQSFGYEQDVLCMCVCVCVHVYVHACGARMCVMFWDTMYINESVSRAFQRLLVSYCL